MQKSDIDSIGDFMGFKTLNDPLIREPDRTKSGLLPIQEIYEPRALSNTRPQFCIGKNDSHIGFIPAFHYKNNGEDPTAYSTSIEQFDADSSKQEIDPGYGDQWEERDDD